MSASREKKQRQGAGLSEKALQTQQQQAERKRKTIIYTVIGVVLAVSVAVLLCWNAWKNDRAPFAFFKGQATAATVGGENISAAELSYYYYNARMSEFYYYSVFGLTVPSDSDVKDSSTGQTYREYFLDAALRSARSDMALAAEARKNGHTDAEVKDSLDAQIQSLKASATAYGYSYSAYLKAMYGNYMNASVFEKLYTREQLAELAYNEKGNELLNSYSEADLKAYYEADDNADTLDTFEYSYLYFTPAAVKDKDADGNARDEDEVNEEKKAALTDAKANAEAALEALRDGGSISDLAEEYELADTNYGDHVTGVGISSAPSAIREKMLSMKNNDVELVENGESGYYVVVFHSRTLVEDPTKDVRHILARAEATTDADGNIAAPTGKAWADAEEKIKAIQTEFEAGNKTEDSFAALANEKSDDGNGTNGGLITKIDVGDSYVPEFLEWIFADGRKVGDTGIVQHEAKDSDGNKYWGYHFIYMVGDNEPRWMRSVRNALATKDISAWQEGLLDNYPAALTDRAGSIGG